MPCSRPVLQAVRGAGGVGAHEDLGVAATRGRDLLERVQGDLDVIGGSVGAGVAGPQETGQRLRAEGIAGLVEVGEQRVEAEAALAGAGGSLLLGVGGDERRVDVDR